MSITVNLTLYSLFLWVIFVPKRYVEKVRRRENGPCVMNFTVNKGGTKPGKRTKRCFFLFPKKYPAGNVTFNTFYQLSYQLVIVRSNKYRLRNYHFNNN